MSKGPKISIITACYNAEKTIEQTIQSVITQTYDNIEYIIVDGASRDRTMEIVERYRKQIDIVISEQDQGIYDAFNKGLKVSTGDYIQYLNADDYLINKNVIKEIIECAKADQYPLCFYGNIIIIDEITDFKRKSGKSLVLDDIQQGKMPPHPATFLKREILESLHGFNKIYSIAADLDLMIRVYSKYADEFKYYPVEIVIFREGGISTHFNTSSKTNEETNLILKKYFGPNVGSTHELSNDIYFKKWLEINYFWNSTIGKYLFEKNITTVYLFGSGLVANLIAKDFIDSGIKVKGFLDNDINRQGMELNGIKICNPQILLKEFEDVDSIIFAFEGNHNKVVENQIKSSNLKKEITLYDWRQLVATFM
ncbi:glycosyltransferase family 2 protein [Psychrobacillus sp. PGGUH221]|uniref:glycosyltransferase family 2 protein n=1 Tax=Psychrobacillus sp. PGGUH221 TaxID=3020058 RepID=UPI0035C6A3D9